MKHKKRRQNKIGIFVTLFICLLLVIVLAGVLLNIRKNDLRLDGIAFYEQGQYTEALQKFDESLLKWAPCSWAQETDILLYEGSCYLLQGDFSAAKNVYDMLAEKKEAGARINEFQQISAGLEAYGLGSYDEAVQILTPYAEAGCNALYLYIGSSYLELGDEEQMLAAFDAYTVNGPESSFLYGEMAAYYIGLADYENAMVQIQAGLQAGDGYKRELRWQEVCCLEYMLDFNGAYEKMRSFAEAYTLTDEEQKEWNFLQTRYIGDGHSENVDTQSVTGFDNEED